MSAPSQEQIRVRAYEIFLSRGASHGNDFHDWLQAEKELGTRDSDAAAVSRAPSATATSPARAPAKARAAGAAPRSRSRSR